MSKCDFIKCECLRRVQRQHSRKLVFPQTLGIDIVLALIKVSYKNSYRKKNIFLVEIGIKYFSPPVCMLSYEW